MAVSAKIIVFASLGLLFTGSARAQQAAAAPEHCEGTLCDLYYSVHGNAADAAPKPSATAVAGVPAGATPLMAPSGNPLTSNPLSRLFGGGSSTASTLPPPPDSEPATASNSYMHLGTGGVLGHSDRCTGTLCDTFYGSSPSESAAPASAQQAAATPVSAAGSAIAYRHITHESETRPKCTSPAGDPWRCFRK